VCQALGLIANTEKKNHSGSKEKQCRESEGHCIGEHEGDLIQNNTEEIQRGSRV
jgi:hypothetical protein